MSAKQKTAYEIMETLDELTPQPAVRCVHQSQEQGLQLCDGGLNDWWRIDIGGNLAWTAAAGGAQGRQRQESLTLKAFQQYAALVFFQSAIGERPILPITHVV